MSKKSWETYEDVAVYLLNQFAGEFDLEIVEGKQKLKGNKSNTDWEIDAKGIKKGNKGFIIIECRRYSKTKQNQGQLATLAYTIMDTGASGGILVSPLGLQAGAKLIANSDNILEIHLDEHSTIHDFSLKFLNRLMVGLSSGVLISDSFEASVSRPCSKCGEMFVVSNNETVCQTCNAN